MSQWQRKFSRRKLESRKIGRKHRLSDAGLWRLEDRTVPANFSVNGGAITILDNPGATTASTANVVVPAGEIVTDLRVTLNGVSHLSPEDIDMILVAPNGTTYLFLMSDAGGINALAGTTFTLIDGGADGPLTTGPINAGGQYLPTNLNQLDADAIPNTPAVTGLVTSFQGFDGVAANGVWTLRIADDTPGNGGTITSWTLAGTSRTNAPPVANPDTFNGTEELALPAAAPGVLVNDTDPDGDPRTAFVVSGPSNGVLTGGLNPNGSFTYTPNPNFAGQDSFTYRVYDGIVFGNTTTVTLNIANINDLPTAVNDVYTVQNGGPQTIHSAIGITSNDVDPDGATNSNFLIETFEGFTLIPFDPAVPGNSPEDPTDWTESIPFGWVRDNTTTPPPATPTAPGAPWFGWHVMDIDSWVTQQGNQERSFFTRGGPGSHGTILVADGDAYADFVDVGTNRMFTYMYTPAVSTGGVVPGSLKLELDSSFRPEDPDPANQFGVIEVSYDGGTNWTQLQRLDFANSGGVNGSLQRVDEHLVYDIAPPAGATTAKFRFGYLDAGNDWWWALDNIKVAGLRTNPATLTPSIVTPIPAAAGTVVLNANGSFVYTPAAGFTGSTSFTYNVFDGVVTSNTATVNLTVNANAVAPVAAVDAYSTLQGVAVNTSYANGLLLNDSDADIGGSNVGLRAILVTGPTPAQGTLVLNADGSFLFTPTPAFFGAATFTYKVNDGLNDSPTVTAAITVIQTNLNPPVANNDPNFTTAQNTPLTVPAPGVLANDTDPDNNPLTALLLVGPAHGSLAFNANGSFNYTPLPFYNGVDTFTYRVSDGNFFSQPATVTITISAANVAPRGTNDFYTTAFNTPLSPSAANGVLRNDQDDGPVVSIFATQTFESLSANLGPFVSPTEANGDGTDWTDVLPTGWTRDNTTTPIGNPIEFQGWNAFDIDSWIATEGNQDRNRFTRGGVGAHGTVLVVDGDAYDDGTDIDGNPNTMNVYVMTPSMNLGSIQPNSLTLEFDSSFRPEDPGNQNGVVEVTYDGGTTWTRILDLNPVSAGGSGSLSRANAHETVDAFNPAGATTAMFRFGYLTAGNDWWWAIDNVGATGRSLNAGATQTATSFTQPAHGTVTGNANGTFTYTPTAGYRGIDSFTYRPNDGTLTGNVTRVTVVVGSQIGVQIDDGSAQRSMVRTATVYLSGAAAFATQTVPGATSGAFTLTGPGGVAVPFTVLSVGAAGPLTAVQIGNFTGALSQNGSLADGRYTLTALSNQITIGGQALDGNNDGTPGGDSVNQLFRFYGDIDGNARIDISDFGFFSSAYLQGPAANNQYLDFNVDGRIDIADFGQFSLRYFTTLP